MNNPLGKPELQLTGSAKAALQRLGGTRVFISLSHEKTLCWRCASSRRPHRAAAAGA